MTAVADKSDIAVVSKMRRMLEKATTVEEIRHVENLAQRARDYAKAAGLGRDAVNRVGRLALDARRKTGATLRAMKERGELAEGRRKKLSLSSRYDRKAADDTIDCESLPVGPECRAGQSARGPAKDEEPPAKGARKDRSAQAGPAGIRGQIKQPRAQERNRAFIHPLMRATQ